MKMAGLILPYWTVDGGKKASCVRISLVRSPHLCPNPQTYLRLLKRLHHSEGHPRGLLPSLHHLRWGDWEEDGMIWMELAMWKTREQGRQPLTYLAVGLAAFSSSSVLQEIHWGTLSSTSVWLGPPNIYKTPAEDCPLGSPFSI